MKKTMFLAIIMIAMFATSCSSTYRAIKEPPVKFELYSSDYVLSEPVTGEASVNIFLGVDWKRLFSSKSATVSDGNVVTLIPITTSESYAIYDLLEKNPGWDFVMYPQIVTKSSGLYPLYSHKKIQVTARLGRFVNKAQ